MASVSPLVAPSAGPAELEGEILRRGWGLVLRVVRRRASSGFRFVFSHCGAPRREAADKAAERETRRAAVAPGARH
ncbi:hypothetical protein ERJ75_001381800 [Trypanosoma vivax]|nr:hypothetical protein ERJ75_001381800 [Trypanosoma vivax]